MTLNLNILDDSFSIHRLSPHDEISIFAISTFDTDYILIKSEKLQAAKKALQQVGPFNHA